MNLSEAETNIMIQVLDKSYKLEEFSIDLIPETLYKWELGGLLDPLGQLINWLWEQISGAFSVVQSALEGVMRSARDFLWDKIRDFKAAVSSTLDLVRSAIRGISSALSGLESYLREKWKDAMGKLGDILDWLPSIGEIVGKIWDGIKAIPGMVTKAITTIAALAAQLPKALKGIGEFISRGIARFFDILKDWFSKAIAGIASTITQLAQTIRTLGPTILRGIGDIGISLERLLSKGIGDLKTWIDRGLKPLLERMDEVMPAITRVGEALMGFVNPLVDLKNWVMELPTRIWRTFQPVMGEIISFFSGLPKRVWAVLKGVTKWLMERGSDLTSFMFDAIETIGASISKVVTVNLSKLWEAASSFGAGVKETALEIVSPLLTAMGDVVSKQLDELYKSVLAGEGESEWRTLSKIWIAILTSHLISRWVRQYLFYIGEVFNEVDLAPSVRLVIAGAGGTKEVRVRVRAGAILKHIGAELAEYPDMVARALIYGFSIWLSQPMSRLLSSLARDRLPIELPPLSMIVEVTRRSMVVNEDFKGMLSQINEIMALFGYSSRVAEWYLKTEDEWFYPIKDRFGREIKIPRGLIYDLPTPSEYSRMMVKDIFATLGDFQKAMQMKGYTVELAKLYYLLHFRYPPLERLFEFICRISAGFGWVKGRVVPIAGLGFPGVDPATLTETYKVNPIDSVKRLTEKLIPYSKWHDYAPFGWIEGFTADRLIMLDLMADIPTRIDSRWMYKWQLIKEEELMRIVVARGMHPDWVKKISQAEMMNALAEERTYARTGVIDLYRHGFITHNKADELLKDLIKIRLLGEDITVAFLESERKLILKRAELDIEDTYHLNYVKNLENKFVAGELTEAQLEEDLKKYIKESKVLESTLVRIKSRKIRDQLYYTHRQLLRNIDAIAGLYEEGWITRDEAEKRIKDIAGRWLTDTQIDLMLTESDHRVERKIREYKEDAIIMRLRSGEITTEKAISQLKNLGLAEDVAVALVEAKAKLYTVSPSRLVDAVAKLYEEGWINREETKRRIKDIAGRWLKDPQIDLMLKEIDQRVERRIKEYQEDAIIVRLRRGVITTDEAISQLKKLGLSHDIAVALVEAKAKVYTISPSRLVSMMEHIPLPQNFLQQKLRALGMPEDEIKLMKAYAFASAIAEEIRRITTELGMLYAKGIISKEEFRRELDNLATLWGEVKDKFGVDWIVLDPDERNYLMRIYELRALRYA